MIAFKKLPIGEEEKKACCDVIDSGYLSRGKKTLEFEEAFADYVGSKYAVATQSCTMALMFALEAKGFGKSTARIPSMTVPLVAHAIIKLGGTIIWVDECDWVGNAYEIVPWGVIDSAHQVLRKQYKDSINENIIHCFSFYPTKPITSIEGGMIVTDNEEMAEYIRSISNYGRNESKIVKNSWEYSVDRIGWKGNMTDMQAAIALCQLRKLDEMNKVREEIRDYYNKNLLLDNKSLYLYRINMENRNEFISYMKDNGVECGVHFAPLHRMDIFKKYTLNENSFLPKTEFSGEHTVSLPFHTFLEQKDLDYIINLTEEWIAKNKLCSANIQN